MQFKAGSEECQSCAQRITAGAKPQDHTLRRVRRQRGTDHHLISVKESLAAFGQTGPMQKLAQTLGCLVLALALVLTGPGGAGPVKGAMLVELCADGTASLVWIDAEGAPVAPGKFHAKCLDCLVFSPPLPEIADGRLTLASLRRAASLSLPTPLPCQPVAHLRPAPRGPPAADARAMRQGDPRPAFRSLHPSALRRIDFHQSNDPVGVIDPRATFESARS